jgi:hypothetical protein
VADVERLPGQVAVGRVDVLLAPAPLAAIDAASVNQPDPGRGRPADPVGVEQVRRVGLDREALGRELADAGRADDDVVRRRLEPGVAVPGVELLARVQPVCPGRERRAEDLLDRLAEGDQPELLGRHRGVERGDPGRVVVEQPRAVGRHEVGEAVVIALAGGPVVRDDVDPVEEGRVVVGDHVVPAPGRVDVRLERADEPAEQEVPRYSRRSRR